MKSIDQIVMLIENLAINQKDVLFNDKKMLKFYFEESLKIKREEINLKNK